MSSLRVSIIVATYNRGSRIASTIESILRQTRLPEEMIVVDDCSSDRTGEWIEANYPQIKVVRPLKNGGTSASRNFGAQVASGNVLVFLDHDDELLPNGIQVLTDLLIEFQQAKAAYADHSYLNTLTGSYFPDHHVSQKSFHRLELIRPSESSTTGRLYDSGIYRALLSGNLLQQPWAIYRDVFFEVGAFSEDIKYCEDWDLYLRVTRSVPIALSDTVISRHIVEGENLHLSPNQAEMHMLVIKKTIKHEILRNPSATLMLSRRLAGYYKAEGDRLSNSKLIKAWKKYVCSFCHWPFDYVVVTRILFWPLKMIVATRTPTNSGS